MSEPTIDERVTRLEQILDRVIKYGNSTPLGRALLAKMGLADA